MDSLSPIEDVPTQRPEPRPSQAEVILNGIERLAVIAAITFVWAAGKLDPTIAVVALMAVVGVSLGERKFKSGKGGGSSVVLALAGFASSIFPAVI